MNDDVTRGADAGPAGGMADAGPTGATAEHGPTGATAEHGPTGATAEHGPAWSASWARASESDLEYWLAFALAACDEADAIALRHFRRDIAVMTKPDRSFVTEADHAVERMIRGRILSAFPDHGLVGEEYGTEAGTTSARWYIDPIDGTHNFIRGVPLFGTLLALEIEGEIQLGVASAPALRERWYARRGGGAWSVGAAGSDGPRRIRASRVERLEDAQVFYGSGRDIAASGRAPGFRALLDDVWRERGIGDFWGYTLLAEGAAEAMIEVDLKSWDVAAPLIIVEEAGGRITDFEGRRQLDSGTILASNGPLHRQLLERVTAG